MKQLKFKELLMMKGRKKCAFDVIQKYCPKELRITIAKFKENKDIKKLKANMRRLVDLVMKRGKIEKDKIIDYFAFEYLQFCEYKMKIVLDDGYEVNIPKFLDWIELKYLLTVKGAKPYIDEIIEKRQKNIKRTLKIKEIFKAKIIE